MALKVVWPLPLFLVASKLVTSMLPFPSMLQGRWNRNHSLRQPPDKPKLWSQVPLFSFDDELKIGRFPPICTALCQTGGGVKVSQMLQTFLSFCGDFFFLGCVCIHLGTVSLNQFPEFSQNYFGSSVVANSVSPRGKWRPGAFSLYHLSDVITSTVDLFF